MHVLSCNSFQKDVTEIAVQLSYPETTMAAMTTAERRGYQQICRDDGAMMVIACDQRGGMRTLLASDP